MDAFSHTHDGEVDYEHLYNLDAGHPKGTINIEQSHLDAHNNDYYNLDVFSGLNGDTFNISVVGDGIQGNEEVNLGSHTVGSTINVGYQSGALSYVALDNVITADSINLVEDDTWLQINSVLSPSDVANVTLQSTDNSLWTYVNTNIVDSQASDTNTFYLKGQHTTFSGGNTSTSDIYMSDNLDNTGGSDPVLLGAQTVNLGPHGTGADNLFLYDNQLSVTNLNVVAGAAVGDTITFNTTGHVVVPISSVVQGALLNLAITTFYGTNNANNFGTYVAQHGLDGRRLCR